MELIPGNTIELELHCIAAPKNLKLEHLGSGAMELIPGNTIELSIWNEECWVAFVSFQSG